MALRHADNFNYYGTNTALMLDGVYGQIGGNTLALAADPDGVTPERVIYLGTGVGSGAGFLRWILPAAHATVGIPVRMWLGGIPSASNQRPRFAEWRDGSNNLIAYAYVTTTGGIAFVNGSGSETAPTAESSGPVLTSGGWYHIESKLVCNISAAASVEIRVEGVTVLTHSGFSTSAGTCAQIQIRNLSSGGSGVAMYAKDLVVWDGSGSQNNDFLGSVQVYEMIPDADVTLGGWTSTGPNGFSVLDNNPPLDGTAYISADDSPPVACEFSLSDLPDDITSIKGLITRVRAAKNDGGDGSLQVSLVSSAAEANGADRPITVAQTYWSDVSELDPNTSAAWLPPAANAAKLKIDRTT